MLAKELKKKLAIIKACTASRTVPKVSINNGWIQPLMPDTVIPRFKWEGTEGITGTVDLKRLQDVIGAMVEVNAHGLDSTEDNFVVYDKNGVSFDIPMSIQEGFEFADVTWQDEVHEVGNLSEYLKNCSPFVADAKTRPVMAGIYVGEDVVASDGFYLRKLPLLKELPEMILPVLVAKAIDGCTRLRMGERVDNDRKITFVKFEGTDVIVDVRCIEGRYPNYNSVIPKECDWSFQINAKKLQGIVKVAALKEESYEYTNANNTKETGYASIFRADNGVLAINGVDVTVGCANRNAGLFGFKTELLKKAVAGLRGKVEMRFKGPYVNTRVGGRREPYPVIFEDEIGTLLLMPVMTGLE